MNKTHRKNVKRLFSLILILFWIAIPLMSFSHDLEKIPKQKITALYLYNFLLFVDWPEKAVSNSSTVKVAIYGDSQLYEAMYLLAGEKIRGKKLAVFSLTKPEALDDSFQVLFVGGEDTQTASEFLKQASGKPILTVGDRPGFSSLGGMVTFKDPSDSQHDAKKQERFIINLSAVHKSRLKIRSRLLRMSDIIYDAKTANPLKGQ